MSTDPRAAIEAEILRTRRELASTVDELTSRLNPKTQAQNAAHATKRAASDAQTFVTGGGLPKSADRSRNVKVLLGAAVAGVLAVAVVVTRMRRH